MSGRVIETPPHVVIYGNHPSEVRSHCRHCRKRATHPLGDDLDRLAAALRAFCAEHAACPAPAATVVAVQWVIYHGASNHPPGAWVVRGHDIMSDNTARPHAAAWERPTLEAARSVIPIGCYNLGRWPGDDPVIVEVWG